MCGLLTVAETRLQTAASTKLELKEFRFLGGGVGGVLFVS